MKSEELNGVIVRIRQAADCRSIFARFWPDKFRKRGNCHCPFHDDSVASLQVSRQLAFCHAENLKFDAINLYARATGLSYVKAAAALAKELGLRKTEDGGRGTENGGLREVAAYDYTDAAGRLLYQVVRFEPKTFRLRRPRPGGAWAWDLNGTPRVPYRLPEVLRADTVFIVEGEKDADRLVRAVGAGSACQHGRSFSETGKPVGPPADIDVESPPLAPVGATAGSHAEATPPKAAAKSSTLIPAAAPSGGPSAPSEDAIALAFAEKFQDVFKYCHHNGSWFCWDGDRWIKEQTRLVFDRARALCRELNFAGKSSVSKASTAAAVEILAQADRRFAVTSEIWDQDIWLLGTPDGTVDLRTGLIRQTAREDFITKQTLVGAAGLPTGVDEALGAPASVDDQPVGPAARVDPHFVSGPRYTQEPQAMRLVHARSFSEGGRSLSETGKPAGLAANVDDHSSAATPALAGVSGDHSTTIPAGGPTAPAAAPTACPVWLRFLDEATNGNAELQRFLQQMAGLSLTGCIREHALFFICGPGGNGKSVFLNTLVNILADYAKTAAMDSFTATKSERHPTDLAMLKGARLVTASETEEGRAWAEGRIKQLTGGDRIAARFMRQDFFEYIPQFKLVFVGNHKPDLRNVDDATCRRFNIVPFVYKPETPDMRLEEKLRDEYPAILRWMIDGCLDWQKNGLIRPETVRDATRTYFDEQDTFGRWIEECCEQAAGESAPSSRLYESWKQFAEANGENAGSSKSFAGRMTRHGFEPARVWMNGKSTRLYRHINLRILSSERRPCGT